MNGSGTTIGGLAVAAVSGVGTLLSIQRQAPMWVTVGGVVIIAVALVVVIWDVFRPSTEPDASPVSRFIRGDVVRSSFEDVTVEADYFIDGGVHGSWFRRILHRPKRR
jgi:hypothetical protein